MVVIKESNMLFGEYEENKVFKIENSELHNKIGNGIKVVEFILLRNGKYIDFIEAKSSSPQPSNDNKERFHEFIEEISDKFIHSFNLYYSGIMKRNIGYEEISNDFFELDLRKINFKFILVIKDHKEEWLIPLSEAIKKKLIYHNRIWKSDIIVINEKLAKQYNLVV